MYTFKRRVLPVLFAALALAASAAGPGAASAVSWIKGNTSGGGFLVPDGGCLSGVPVYETQVDRVTSSDGRSIEIEREVIIDCVVAK